MTFVASIVFVSRNAVGSQYSNAQVFFHAKGLRSDLSIFGEGSSERIYEQSVDTSSLMSSSAAIEGLTAQIPASAVSGRIPGVPTKDPLGRPIYFGYVAWLLPIQTLNQISGDVEITAWMSSDDGSGFGGGTGYFFALADLNPQNPGDATFQNLWYDGTANSGNVIGSSPRPLSTKDFGRPFKIMNHQFAAGRSLAFFAGAGSNKQGWRFNVYFDSADKASGAVVPITLFSSLTITAVATSSQQSTTTPASTPGCAISVSLTANPTSGPVPLTVTFNAAVSNSYGAVQYDWWFGDGSHITGIPTMTYTYQNSWNYSVFVRVLDYKGCWSQTNETISVTPVPVAEFPSISLLVIVITFVVLSIVKFKRRSLFS